jgi:hypothetical protein
VPFYFFVWDEENEQHIADNDVTTSEFEEVVCHPERTAKSRSSGLPIAFGHTSTGKFIAAVYRMIDKDTAYAVTAYEIFERD